MRIFPRYELRPRLKGEGKIYELLASIPDDNAFAVHSFNLPEHDYKRWGEADFIVVSPTGLKLLEIKGGVVSFVDRVWQYKNARGEAITSTEGPARQAMSAAIALEKMLSERLGKKIRCRWGVAFPLCTFKKQLAELPSSRLADIRVCDEMSSFAEWLSNIPYDQHQPSEFALSNDDLAAIKEIILHEFSATNSLALAVKSLYQESIRLTEQQFNILESLQDNPRICVSGGAGTGKTELAVLCARAELAAGRRPVIVTTGSPLTLALRARLSQPGIPVATDFLPEGTDTLIVDE
jgi:hypothetical protein